MNLELQEVPADTYANVWSRENLVVMQRNSVPGLQANAPALGLGGLKQCEAVGEEG